VQLQQMADRNTDTFATAHYVGTIPACFYAWKQLLLSARLSHRSSVCPSVCSSVRHMGGL